MRRLNPAKLLRLLVSRIETDDHQKRRALGIAQGVLTSLGSRAVAISVSFLSVPLAIGYLGTVRYGVWVTLGSLLAWLQLSDFGLGMGLTNAVTKAVGQDRPDLVRKHVSNGFFLLLSIAAVVGVLAASAWPFFDLGALFRVDDPVVRHEVDAAAATALLIFLLRFPLDIAEKVYTAYFEGRLHNYWSSAGNLLSFGALLAVVHTEGGLVWLVVAVSGASLVVNGIGVTWLFFVHRPSVRPSLSSVDLRLMADLVRMSGQYLVIQVSFVIAFSTDTFIIASFLGAGQVPEYTLTYRLFSFATLPQAIVYSYLLAAYNEALARNDFAWVRQAFRRSLLLGLGFTLAATGVLCLFAKTFVYWWAREQVVPSTGLIVWMAAWALVDAFTNPIACLLAAATRLRFQVIYTTLAAGVNVILSLYLVQVWGVTGVIAASVISYALFVCVPSYLDVQLLLRSLRPR